MFKKNKTLWLIVALVAVVAVVVLILCLRGCGSQTEPESKTVQTQESVRAGKVSESDNKTDTKSNSDKATDKSGEKATTDKDTAGKDSKEGNTAEEKNSSTSDSENHSSTSESENYTSTSDGNESSGNGDSTSSESYSEPEPVYTPTPEPVTPAHVHSYTDTVIAPSCTTNGYTVHTCDCGDSYTDSNVSAWGHDLQPVYETRTVEKTAEEVHTFCRACGADLTAMGLHGEALSNHSMQHAFNGESSSRYENVVKVIETSTEDVLTGYTCSRCGATKQP